MGISYFTRDHEWISLDEDIATVGITIHAQEQLGDLVFVELPEVGTIFSVGDNAVVVESVKAASDVYSPVSGEIVEINQTVVDNPGIVNSSAQAQGWLFRIRLSDKSELDDLLDEAAYKALIS